MTQRGSNGDASGSDDGTHEVYEMNTIELDEHFGFGEDPEFRQACAHGHAAFVQAVLDMSARRSTETLRGSHGGRPDQGPTKRQQRLRLASDEGSDLPSRGGRGRLRKGGRVTGTQRQRLVDDLRRNYERGVTIRTLAEETGRSFGYVYRLLSEAGLVRHSQAEAAQTTKENEGASPFPQGPALNG